jgi:hypothetical protein
VVAAAGCRLSRGKQRKTAVGALADDALCILHPSIGALGESSTGGRLAGSQPDGGTAAFLRLFVRATQQGFLIVPE